MSDIFNEYCKIMEEQGHIRKDAQESKALTRVEKETSEDYREKIKALYGLDIKLNDSNKDIIEQAHPETVVIAPSYDKMNGVVENIQERSNVMKGISQKPVNGNLTGHKYAKKELLDELIRLGFDLDNQGEEGLAKEATSAAVQISEYKEESIKKEAFLGALLSGVGAVLKNPWFWKGIGVASMWGPVKKNLIGYIELGPEKDCERAVDALENLLGKVEGSDKALCRKYVAAFKMYLKETKQTKSIMETATIDQDVSKIESSADILAAKTKIKGTQKQIDIANKYLETSKKVVEAIGSRLEVKELVGIDINKVVPNIQNMKVQTEEKDWTDVVGDIWDASVVSFFTGGETDNDPKTHAVNALLALKGSIKDMLIKHKSDNSKAASKSQEEAKSAFDQFQEFAQQTTQSAGNAASSATETVTETASNIGKYFQ